MFNTMTLTKLVGGIGAPLLVFLLGIFAGGLLYSTDSGGHEQADVTHAEQSDGHSDETAAGDEAAADEPATEEAVADEPVFADLLAAADVAKGEKVFKKCKACHKTEVGANAVGPYLVSIVGRQVAAVEDFKYSDPMRELGGEWTAERINEYLIKPKAMVPGTKMSFSGLKKIEDRANVIGYLATITE